MQLVPGLGIEPTSRLGSQHGGAAHPGAGRPQQRLADPALLELAGEAVLEPVAYLSDRSTAREAPIQEASSCDPSPRRPHLDPSQRPFLSPHNFAFDGRDPPAETLVGMAVSR